MSDDDNRTPLGDLDERIRKARERHPDRNNGSADDVRGRSALGFGFRIGVELVSALLVGLGLGYLLDQWLGTGPWAMIAMFFLGAGAGIANVFRAASGLGFAPGYWSSKGRSNGRDP